MFRQRNESTSSLSVGSWQMISGTGSLRSAADSHLIVDPQQNNLNQTTAQNNTNSTTPNANQFSQDSSCTMIDDDCFSSVFSNDISFM